jgi:hypothetical protein
MNKHTLNFCESVPLNYYKEKSTRPPLAPSPTIIGDLSIRLKSLFHQSIKIEQFPLMSPLQIIALLNPASCYSRNREYCTQDFCTSLNINLISEKSGVDFMFTFFSTPSLPPPPPPYTLVLQGSRTLFFPHLTQLHGSLSLPLLLALFH